MPYLYDEIITRTDVPVNLSTTGMVTNAYLYTGNEKYKQWVLNYVDASMAAEDWKKIEVLMEKNKYRPLSDEGIWGQNTLGHLDTKTWEPSEPFDWTEEVSMGDRSLGKSEHLRLMYYAGKNPDWPLKADYQEVMRRMRFMQNDTRNIYTIWGDDLHPNNPVITKALVQTTMGTPQSIYFGGLLRARLCYFDADRQRPGLPQDVAALVEPLEADRTVVQLANLSLTESRKLIVQAGAFGDHSFTSLSYQQAGKEEGTQAATGNTVVNGKYFMVELPPATSIRLDIGTERFVNPPSYAFPWHGGKVPLK